MEKDLFSIYYAREASLTFIKFKSIDFMNKSKFGAKNKSVKIILLKKKIAVNAECWMMKICDCQYRYADWYFSRIFPQFCQSDHC